MGTWTPEEPQSPKTRDSDALLAQDQQTLDFSGAGRPGSPESQNWKHHALRKVGAMLGCRRLLLRPLRNPRIWDYRPAPCLLWTNGPQGKIGLDLVAVGATMGAYRRSGGGSLLPNGWLARETYTACKFSVLRAEAVNGAGQFDESHLSSLVIWNEPRSAWCFPEEETNGRPKRSRADPKEG
jgi:hypothetical protein